MISAEASLWLNAIFQDILRELLGKILYKVLPPIYKKARIGLIIMTLCINMLKRSICPEIAPDLAMKQALTNNFIKDYGGDLTTSRKPSASVRRRSLHSGTPARPLFRLPGRSPAATRAGPRCAPLWCARGGDPPGPALRRSARRRSPRQNAGTPTEPRRKSVRSSSA